MYIRKSPEAPGLHIVAELGFEFVGLSSSCNPAGDECSGIPITGVEIQIFAVPPAELLIDDTTPESKIVHHVLEPDTDQSDTENAYRFRNGFFGVILTEECPNFGVQIEGQLLERRSTQ